MTEGVPIGDTDNLTLEHMLTLLQQFKPAPNMPRWKDLTWSQRNMIAREIDAIENRVIRAVMRASYYRNDD